MSMDKKKIIIVGAGFGGINVANILKKTNSEIYIIDKQNHHLFQPLLYQVAAGVLSASDIATPIRSVIGKRENTFIRMEEVVKIDKTGKKVFTRENEYLYDYLVVATGSTYSYFGNEQWKKYTYNLKTLSGAVKLRNQIYHSLELAISTKDTKLRSKCLNFVVVGGGPTGVEMAGVISEACEKLCQEEMKLDFKDINIYLIEGLDRVLGPFHPSLSEYALEALEKKGVKVRLKAMVKDIGDGYVETNEFRIETNTIIWAAGVEAVGAPDILNENLERGRKIMVNEYLNLDNDKNIFVIGDCSHLVQEGRPLPGLGSVAKQQGVYVGKELKKLIKGDNARNRFEYKDFGTMATIGRNAAVADIFGIKLKGFVAWLLWGLVHIALLVDFRNRIAVFSSWVWAYLLNNIGSRNITLKISKEDSFQE
jgi:NADH dehydrogenase